ncbi:MAG: PAS domain S-box protein [Haloarculaceae archaeon]
MDVDRQWLCERIVEETGDAVLFVDADGVIRLWNESAEQLFGYPHEEAVGSSLDIIVPEEFRRPHWAGFDAAVEDGATRSDDDSYATVPALHADGDRITIQTSGAQVVARDGEVVGVFNTIRRAEE